MSRLHFKCYISLYFYYTNTYNTECKQVETSKDANITDKHISFVSIFFWTRNNNWTNSLIAMQAPFVRYIIPEADSGLVKIVVMTNVFFNKQQHEIKIKRFIFVKYIKSRFFCNSWNQCFHSACKTWRSVFTEGTIKENLMQLSEKHLIYKQRVRDGQMGITPQFLDDIPGSYGEAASLSYCSARGQYWWENVCVGVLLTPLMFH